jgi:proline iminopeptidase
VPPAQSSDEHFWLVEEDIQLYHFSAGEGRNVLVVHGGPGYPPVEAWPGLESFTGAYRFHYYHQRGCGQSTRPIDTFSSSNYSQNGLTLDRTLGLGAQIADIERIRQILGEEKLIIIGHSFGGFLASLYAAEFPERVDGLVLVAPADMLVMPQESGGAFEEMRERLPADMREEYDAYLKEYLNFSGLFTKSEAELVALNGKSVKYYEAVFETPMPVQGEPGGWMVWGMYFSLGRRHDYRDALQSVDVPVLVLHGTADIMSEEGSRTYVDAFPTATFREIDGAGHFPFHNQPGAFAQVVEEFLDGLE